MWLPQGLTDTLNEAFWFGVAFVMLLAVGILLNRLERAPRRLLPKAWIRALSNQRQLRIDLLRAQGHTRHSATRQVDEAEQAEARAEAFRSQVHDLRDMQELVSSPDREAEFRALAPAMMEDMRRDFANGVMPAGLEDLFIESLLEVRAATDQAAARMLAGYRDGSARDSVKELLRATTRKSLGI